MDISTGFRTGGRWCRSRREVGRRARSRRRLCVDRECYFFGSLDIVHEFLQPLGPEFECFLSRPPFTEPVREASDTKTVLSLTATTKRSSSAPPRKWCLDCFIIQETMTGIHNNKARGSVRSPTCKSCGRPAGDVMMKGPFLICGSNDGVRIEKYIGMITDYGVTPSVGQRNIEKCRILAYKSSCVFTMFGSLIRG